MSRAALAAAPEDGRPIDLARAERAVGELLRALGADPEAPGLRDTPRRVARLYQEALTPAPFRPTIFPNESGHRELVLVRDIAFSSLCEHHLLPFFGVAHVGYLPRARLIGLSKMPRAVECLARGLGLQERLTDQVADWLEATLAPVGVGVVLEGRHLCLSARGARQPASVTRTAAFRGRLAEDPAARAEFHAALQGS